jgi:transposase
MRGKKYRQWSPTQSFLLPPSPEDWLPEDDLAFFILDVVEVLDLREIERRIQWKDHRGTRPYHPKMMTALLLYGYSVGVVSSRKIEQATYRDVAFRVIASGNHPDHSVIADFRRRHLGALKELFLQTVRLSQEAGLVSLGRVALDGTKVQANASKHKAMSYERMQKAEAKLEEEIKGILAQAEETDREEDRRYGRRRRGDELPEELRRREHRLRKIREAKQALEAEARRTRRRHLTKLAEQQEQQEHQAEDPIERKRAATRARKLRAEAAIFADDDDDSPPQAGSGEEELPRHQLGTTTDGKPKPKAQRNFTDPDSRVMKRGHEYLQGYNCQAVVDEDHQVIVGCAVTNQAPDQQHFRPLVETTRGACGDYPKEVLADNGYWAESNVDYCVERGIEPYIATGRQKHGERTPPARGPPSADEDTKGRMTRKLRQKKGRETYARRKAIVEPPFGQMKEVRGLKRFLLRGLEKVRGEWALWCATHNLLKIYRVRYATV